MHSLRLLSVVLLLAACPRVSGERLATLEAENAEQRKQIETLQTRLDTVETFLDEATGGKYRSARPPDPAATYSLPIAGSPVKGPETALVTVVEIAEFG